MGEADWVAGKRLCFTDVGAGHTLVFLHAFPLSGAMWRAQLQAFRAQFRVIVPELPGFGGSDPIQPWSSPMDRMGDAVAELLENMRLSRAVFVGCSMGAYVALQIAQRYPKMVKGLALVSGRATADDEPARQRRIIGALEVVNRGTAVLEPMAETLVAPSAPQALRDHVLAMIREGSGPGAAAAMRGMAARGDSTAWLARAPCPIWAVRGADDGLVDEAAHQALAAAPGATALTVPGAGHLVPMEAPEAFNEGLRDFLAGLKR